MNKKMMGLVVGAVFALCVSVVQAAVIETDLSLDKSAGDSSASVGDELTYTLYVINEGALPAQNVVVTDYLDDALAVTGVSATKGVIDYYSVGHYVEWIVGELAAGETATGSIVTEVLLTAAGTTLINTAGVTADTLDPNPANNEDSVDVRINQVPEPHVLALMGLGLGVLGFARNKKQV